MSKFMYIIPGYRENVRSTAIREIAKQFRLKGYEPLMVKIQWKYSTMSDYVNQLKEQLARHGHKRISFFGFSWGAMIAFIAAVTTQPENLYLCSLSPYFKEDLQKTQEDVSQSLGKRRVNDLLTFTFNQLAPKVEAKTILLVGENELPSVLKRVKEASRKIRRSSLTIVKNASHRLEDNDYHHGVINKIRK